LKLKRSISFKSHGGMAVCILDVEDGAMLH
jgi:hypothetical protein